MKLSTRSRYGVRLMFNLAYYYKKGPVQLSEIAEREGISLKYLSQIVIQLKNSGLITAVRGAKGGYLLTRDPAEITMKDLVEVLEGNISIVDCLHEGDDCDQSSKCSTQKVWTIVNDKIVETLQGITLTELVQWMKDNDANMYYI